MQYLGLLENYDPEIFLETPHTINHVKLVQDLLKTLQHRFFNTKLFDQ